MSEPAHNTQNVAPLRQTVEAAPLDDTALDEIRRRNRYLAAIPFETHGPGVHGDNCPPCGMEPAPATTRAGHNPRLRCIIVKAAPDRDLYIGWSNVVEAPTGMWTRAEALAYGFPRSRLDRADRTGTSSMVPGSGQWGDHVGFIAEQRGWLRRDRIADYAQALLAGNQDAAWDLLEPFDDETEVRRG